MKINYNQNLLAIRLNNLKAGLKKVKGDKIFDENFNENYDFQNIKKRSVF